MEIHELVKIISERSEIILVLYWFYYDTYKYKDKVYRQNISLCFLLVLGSVLTRFESCLEVPVYFSFCGVFLSYRNEASSLCQHVFRCQTCGTKFLWTFKSQPSFTFWRILALVVKFSIAKNEPRATVKCKPCYQLSFHKCMEAVYFSIPKIIRGEYFFFLFLECIRKCLSFCRISRPSVVNLVPSSCQLSHVLETAMQVSWVLHLMY